MVDVFTSKKRSEIMSHIRSTDTKAELIVFRYLRRKNIYFQKHYSRGLGKPDIALPRKKKAVFIDGDFWHGRTIDRLINRGVSNSEYWIPKIKRNIERDIEQNIYYKNEGWKILRVWESDIMRKRDQDTALKTIEEFLIT